jgi:TonB family protein
MPTRRLAALALALWCGAAAAAPPPPQAAEDAYRAEVRGRIATLRGLLRPFYLTAGEVVLGLEIDRRGRLVNGAILAGSGSAELDRAAARMATFAAPFAPPPAELAGDPVALQVVLKLPRTQAEWDALLDGAPEPPGL